MTAAASDKVKDARICRRYVEVGVRPREATGGGGVTIARLVPRSDEQDGPRAPWVGPTALDPQGGDAAEVRVARLGHHHLAVSP